MFLPKIRCLSHVRLWWLHWCALVYLVPVAVSAHNGILATARPIEGIVIDGDAGDWPSNDYLCQMLGHPWEELRTKDWTQDHPP